MNKYKYRFLGLALIIASLTCLIACEEETTNLGSGIAAGEVEIAMDTFYFNLNAKPIRIDSFDSKTGNLMLGSIDVSDYGKLSCSFVTRLMCASDLQIPDSLLLPERVDSCKLILGAARNEITGDSLSPQKLSIFLLDKQLPSYINNNFNPEGLYNPNSPIGSVSYTISNIASSDSMFYKGKYVEITADLPREFGAEIFRRYKETPEIFQWPQALAKNFIPGLYVKPSFGKGCVANITELFIAVFYHSKEITTTINDTDTVKALTNVSHTVIPFSVSPEVLSSNNISYIPSEKIEGLNMLNNGECIITTPGGYIASFEFPIKPIIDRYKENNIHLSTVNDLTLYLPAEKVKSESNMPVVSNILLIKSSEYESFFKENKIPDNITSFTGAYDAEKSQYVFSSMRQYFLNMLAKDELSEEDLEFTLVPVEITTETNVNNYYGTTSTFVTKCTPYIIKPTLTLLKTNDAMVAFSFSTQLID